jgi:[CysO sulfur-carrier protein]-thiocarboxylate-dependent cysteine synthase
MIARIKGYPIKIVLPENVSIERRQLLEIFGAEIILTPGEEGSNGAVRGRALAAASTPSGLPLPVRERGQPAAHYEGTGPEIWRDAPRSPTSWPASAPAAR